MKYYSEDTVKKIIEDTVNATLHICKPKGDYPCIEIKEPHGRLGDLDALEEQVFDDDSYLLVHSAPTIIEASEEQRQGD